MRCIEHLRVPPRQRANRQRAHGQAAPTAHHFIARQIGGPDASHQQQSSVEGLEAMAGAGGEDGLFFDGIAAHLYLHSAGVRLEMKAFFAAPTPVAVAAAIETALADDGELQRALDEIESGNG